MVDMSTPNASTRPTCPLCAEELAEVDYLHHGYEETVYVCEGCDLRLSADTVAELAAQAEADAPELEATRGLEPTVGWAVLVGDEVAEVCDTMGEAEATAAWLVASCGALTATVQRYDETGDYLRQDHGC